MSSACASRRADLQAATAAVRAIEAQARSRRWDLQRAVQNVDSQVALLHARVAAVAKSKAALRLAQVEFDRARQLVGRGDVSREVYDQRQAEQTTAGAELAQTLAEVYQIRVSLGLRSQPDEGGDLGQVPPDLDETFSACFSETATRYGSWFNSTRRSPLCTRLLSSTRTREICPATRGATNVTC